ncbi:FtsQ-type POTRA domain-containing protein [Comamonadaceae bacterium OH2545_COT-014]|nr:FtsQ-type POTRA domain-containing protein [Comamonadaceae bacterium OH2545_COT-014]
MSDALPVPLDVRLMNVTASLLVTGLVLAGMVAALWWGLRHPAFSIRHITVAGDVAHNSAASLGASVVPRLAGNFFTLDLGGAQAAFQTAPWVRRAVVQREFPNRLHVTLQEHVPAAYWGDEGNQLVNVQGEVFDAQHDDVEEGAGLPRLAGPEGQSALVLAMYQRLAPLVAPLGARLERLTLQARGNWHAVLDKGTVIELGYGAPDTLADRLTQFAATAREVAARYQRTPDAIERADLRHASGYALRLRGVTTLRPDAATAAVTVAPARPAAARPAPSSAAARRAAAASPAPRRR